MKKIYTLVAIFLLASAGVKATDAGFAGGTGTKEDPFLVASEAHLDNVRNHMNAYFLQTLDIILTSEWEPIGGTANRFTGHYDGGNKTISNLVIFVPARDNNGLFGHIGMDQNGATSIRNVHLVNVEVTGGRGTGSLVGRVTGNRNTVIENCSVTGGTVKGDGATGGLVGSNNSYMTNSAASETFRPIISKCFADVNVSLRHENSGGKDKFGGLVGCNQKGFIVNSYATGNVDAPEGYRIGGLTGCVELRGIAVNSYAIGLVNGEEAANIGALVGNMGLNNNEGTVVSCYWLESLDGAQTSAGGEKLDDTQMKEQSSYDGWDFEGIWQFDTSEDYPYPVLKEMSEEPGVWIWTDAVSTGWFTEENWNKGTVPPSNARIEIMNNHHGHLPVLYSDISVNEIYFHPGARLTLNEGASLTVTGKLERYAVSEPQLPEITGAGQLIMQGFATQNIPSFVFENLTINNLSNVMLTGDIYVNNQLKMENGFLDLNGKVIYLDSEATLLEWENSNTSSRVFGDNDGYIEIAVDLSNTLGNIAGMGIEIEIKGQISSYNPAITTIRRGHNSLNGGDDSESIFRWFDIINAPEGENNNLNATMVFHYLNGELNLDDEANNFSLFRSDKVIAEGGINWEWDWVASIFDPVTQTLTASGLRTFSIWTAGSSDNPLPIDLLSFNARTRKMEVLVEWVTATEINNDYFTLERSADGVNFKAIATLHGAGTTSSSLHYSYTDTDPLSGVSYYRLRQTDFDGTTEVFSPVSVFLNDELAENYRMFPNPSNGNFNIQNDSNSDVEFRIYDMQGRSVYRSVLQAHGLSRYNLPQLNKGIYTVVFYGNEIRSAKLQIL